MLFAFAPFPLYIFGLWKRPALYLGLLIQIAYLVARGIELGRLPLVGPHDTLTLVSMSMVAFSIPFRNRLKEHAAVYKITAGAAAVFTGLSCISPQHDAPLPPVLKIIWFELHVVLAFLSYALFCLGAVIGYRFLRSRDYILEGMQYRTILTGYCLFSLSMIFGGIWAYLAWGTYWLWTPKELWTTILWIYYSLYLHARLKQEWMGKPSAVIGITGFGIVLFTYLGVSLLMKSSHTF